MTIHRIVLSLGLGFAGVLCAFSGEENATRAATPALSVGSSGDAAAPDICVRFGSLLGTSLVPGFAWPGELDTSGRDSVLAANGVDELPTLSLAQDSIPSAPPRPRLLPVNISFFERAMWGESGFFRSTGIASPLTPEVRKSELSVRRTMLTMHQIGGFVTLALMGTTVYYGQRYLDRADRTDRNMHQTFVAATIASYAATGLLAILSPPPVIRRDEISTTTIHKTLAWLHVAGMIITPILGASINRRGGSFNSQAHFHQVSAYITTAVFAASMIIITF